MSSPNTRKATKNDILIRLTVANRGPEKATLHLLPTLWFRNTWSWGAVPEECTTQTVDPLERDGIVRVEHEELGEYEFAYEGDATPLFHGKRNERHAALRPCEWHRVRRRTRFHETSFMVGLTR